MDIGALSQEDLAKLRDAVADVRSSLDLRLRTGRYSCGFVMELVQHDLSRGYNIHAIFDEIGCLEGTNVRPSITKRAEAFTSDILRGLWHKHHHQAGFIARNLMLEMNRPGAMHAVLAPYFGRTMDEVSGQIAYAMTVGAYASRAGEHRMTGEWIVFEPQPQGNYYVTLAQHPKPGDDRQAFNAALRARVETYREYDRQIAAAGARAGHATKRASQPP